MGAGDIPEPGGRTVAATKTSFRIIEALKRHEGAGITELADDLGLAKATVHKHLSTLREIDYVIKDDGVYRLAVGFLGLGATARSRLDIYAVSERPLTTLSESVGETASVMIPEHGRGIYVERIAPDSVEAPPVRVGERVPLHATAGGKAILAYTDEETRERIFDYHGLDRKTDQTITDRDQLAAELQNVHDVRTAYDRGEHVEGWYCVASPITDEDGNAIGAITVTGPEERMIEKLSDSDIPSFLGSTSNSIRNRLRRRRRR